MCYVQARGRWLHVLEAQFVFPEVLCSFIQRKSAGDKNTNVLGLLLKRQSGVGVNPNGGRTLIKRRGKANSSRL